MTKKIIAQKVTSKQGQSARTGKVYTKYGLQDQDGTWYNSFMPIQAQEGCEYEIEYEEGKFGNDLKSIKPVAQEEHKVNNDNRQNSIIRQHSQHVALLWTAQHPVNDLEELKSIIDWFDEDAKGIEIPF